MCRIISRLMNLTDGEIAEIHPDYIVLDELHRTGAEEWGKGEIWHL